MKYCGGCGEIKPPGEFYASKVNSDGLRGKCKACWNAESAAGMRRWRSRDGGAMNRARTKKWARDNPDLHREQWRRDNRARTLGRTKSGIEYAAILKWDACSYCGDPVTARSTPRHY